MRGMRRERSQRGLVLLSLVLILALLGLATGASLWLTRAELWAAGRARSEAQAAYTAEAGVRHGLAVLAPDVGWEALRALSVEALSSADVPGPWTIGAGGFVAFPGPPFGYVLDVVRGAPVDPARVVVQSSATAVRGAALVALASVSRAVGPYAPAAVVLAGGDLEVEAAALGSSSSPLVEIRGTEDVPALATASALELDRALGEAHAGGVALDGGETDTARMYDLARFARRSGLPEDSITVLAVARGSPVALRIRGGAAGSLRGAGVVLVAGDLDVVGEVDFDGVLLVDGRLRLGGGACRVAGMVWVRALSFAGPCRLTFDDGAVAEADRALRLPRLPVLTALARGS